MDGRHWHSRTALYLLALLTACTIGTFYASGAQEAAEGFTLLLGTSFTLWAAADARYHCRPLPTLSLWVVFFFWPIAVPACVIRIYGWLAGSIYVVLHLILLALLLYGPWLLFTLAAAQ